MGDPMTAPQDGREPQGSLSVASANRLWNGALVAFVACFVAMFLLPLPYRYLTVAGAGAALATLTLVGLLLAPYRRREGSR
jgi:hypothetical protein